MRRICCGVINRCRVEIYFNDRRMAECRFITKLKTLINAHRFNIYEINNFQFKFFENIEYQSEKEFNFGYILYVQNSLLFFNLNNHSSECWSRIVSKGIRRRSDLNLNFSSRVSFCWVFTSFFFWQQSFFFFAKFIYDDFKPIRCRVRNFQIFEGLIILFYDEFSSDI